MKLYSAAVLLFVLTSFGYAAPSWDLEKLSEPPKTFPAAGFESGSENIRPLFYEGLPYQNKPTRVFAWVGLPKIAPGTKVPAMVLVHGGGGTAFANWVKLWTERGYAAISMDTCGALPFPEQKPRPRHDFSGPPGWGGFDQIDQPATDQWTYHAVADAILAHSLLRSLPEVDADRTGLTGISWGGYLTCIIAGTDPRFKFAVPVYGCGFYRDTTFAASVDKAGADGGSRWMEWWDPSRHLPKAKVPMLWVTGTNDFAYWFPGLQKTYQLLPEGQRSLAVRIRMPHGHGAAGEAPREIAVFADQFLKGGDPMARITSQKTEGGRVTVQFESRRPIKKAELNVTTDTGAWPKRNWTSTPASLEGDRAMALLPEGTTVYYLNLFDDRDCVTSSEHIDLAP